MADIYTQEEAKLLLIQIYGKKAQLWNMNDDVINLLIEVTYDVRNCSNVIFISAQTFLWCT